MHSMHSRLTYSYCDTSHVRRLTPTHPGFMVASGGVLSEGYGHDGPGACLGDGQTEAEGIPSRRPAPAYIPIPDLT